MTVVANLRQHPFPTRKLSKEKKMKKKKPKQAPEEAAKQLIEIIDKHLSTLTPIQCKQAKARFDKYMERFKGH